jgi:hypothetical protein
MVFYVEDKEDLLALRLTCSILCRTTHTAFTKAFYHTIETSLTISSMQRLNRIAAHKHLSAHVKELHFVATGQITREDMCRERHRTIPGIFELGYQWREDKDKVQRDYLAIKNLSTLLTTAFIHCRSFQIGKARASWIFSDHRRHNCITSVDVLAVILRVVALTGIKVQSFAVESKISFSKPPTGYLNLLGEYVVLHPAENYIAEFWDFGFFADGWSALQDLDLAFQEDNHDINFTDYDKSKSAENNGQIIIATKNLKRLRLSFHNRLRTMSHYSWNWHDSLLQRLCSSGFAPPALETLVLDLGVVPAEDLIAFLSQVLKSVKTLVSQDTCLSSGIWHSVLASLLNFPSISNLESLTIVKLRQYEIPPYHTYGTQPLGTCLSFRYFRYNKYLPAPFLDERFEFMNERKDLQLCKNQGIRYRGKNMPTALAVLRNDMEPLDWEHTMKQETGEEADFELDEWRW